MEDLNNGGAALTAFGYLQYTDMSAAPLLGVRSVEAVEVLFDQAAAHFGGNGEARLGPERLGIAEHAIQIEDDPIGVSHVRREGLICRHRRKGSGARTLRA